MRRAPRPVHTTVPALVSGACRYLTPAPLRWSIPLLLTVTELGWMMPPEVQLNLPRKVSGPVPSKLPPHRLNSPLVLTLLAAPNVREAQQTCNVWVPDGPPKVRLAI